MWGINVHHGDKVATSLQCLPVGFDHWCRCDG
jgi:hypothetical protein